MRMQNKLIFFFEIILLTLFQTTTSQTLEPQLDFLGGRCSTSENITINGTYHTNILNLLSNLQSLSSINQFILDSSGVGPDHVKGLFLCRPDVDLATCERCFVDATTNIFEQYCYNKKEAIIWYEECMIRYTNKSLSPSNNETEPWYFNYSTFNISEPETFPEFVNTTMKALISKAVSPENKPKFYALHGQNNFTFFEGFYGMVLCRPDITPEDCERCLTTALERIPSCCVDSLSQWTTVFLPNCQLRYDTAPFIFPSQGQPLSPSSSPSPSSRPLPPDAVPSS